MLFRSLALSGVVLGIVNVVLIGVIVIAAVAVVLYNSSLIATFL